MLWMIKEISSPLSITGKTRRERHDELIKYSIQGGITQARIAHEASNGNGRIHMNVLWEMGAVEPILHGVLSQVKGLVRFGVTCGAGMPYKLAEICVHYGVLITPSFLLPASFSYFMEACLVIVPDHLGGVVYEDPWRAGGHNGISNSEDPNVPEDPMPRVIALRSAMNELGLHNTPIIMAGGVWWLSEWSDWLDNKDIGPIAFQFGTRPLLTQEKPYIKGMEEKLLSLKPGDIAQPFQPTRFIPLQCIIPS